MAGKSYRCLRCGACCVGDGSAFLYPDDLRSLAGHLGLSLQATIDRHTDYLILEIPDGAHGWLYLPYLILKKDAKERCVFLKEALCCVHAAKPAQCRETPFVEEFFSDDEWNAAVRKNCPGLRDADPATLPKNAAPDAADRERRYLELLRENSYNLEKILGVTLPAPRILTRDELS